MDDAPDSPVQIWLHWNGGGGLNLADKSFVERRNPFIYIDGQFSKMRQIDAFQPHFRELLVHGDLGAAVGYAKARRKICPPPAVTLSVLNLFLIVRENVPLRALPWKSFKIRPRSHPECCSSRHLMSWPG